LVQILHCIDFMKKNVGSKERYGRVLVGTASSLAAGLVPMGIAARVGLFLIGLTGLSTGIMQYCPINQLLGIDRFQSKSLDKTPEETERKVA
jgi:hypothetical protein